MTAAPTTPHAGRRDDTIDVFRAVAILSVMAFHYLYRWGPSYDGLHYLPLDTQFPAWLTAGKHGVLLFFVISGLVIAKTLLSGGSAIDFAVKRFARLYPPYLFALLLTFVVVELIGPPGMRVGITDLLVNLTMAPEPLGFAYVDGAYWTLFVEVTFYAYAALGLLLFRDRFWMIFVPVGLLGAALYALTPRGAIYLFIAPHLPFFLAGVAAYYALYARQRRPALILGGLAVALYALYAPRLSPLDHAFVLGSSGLMLCLLAARIELSVPVLPYLGRISYSLYLVHQNLGVSLMAQLKERGAPDALALGGGLAVVLGLAIAMHHAIELPAQRAIVGWWRKRRPDRPAAAAVAADVR